MSKHDTWVTLKAVNPLSEIIHLFPSQQVPMRDPFPMELAISESGNATLFTIDLDRLSSIQTIGITTTYANYLKVSCDEVLGDALKNKGFGINSLYVDQLFCGPEGYQRTKEVADFYGRYPNPTPEQLVRFMQEQRERWVDGNEQPPPMPKQYKDFDPRLQTPELEETLNQIEINDHFSNYSVFDVLQGRAMVDWLNKQDSDYSYELVGLEELLEDD